MLATTIGNTLLNVAIPTLIADLQASNAELQWILDSYVLVFAGLLVASVALGDRVGRRRVLTIGLVLFAAGSVVGATATSPGQLIVGRAVMGAGAAGIMPLTLSILTNLFVGDRDRGRAIAVWSAVATSGGLYGPLLAGWMLDHFWWGSAFAVNIPIALGALIAVLLFAPESHGTSSGPIDGAGLVVP